MKRSARGQAVVSLALGFVAMRALAQSSEPSPLPVSTSVAMPAGATGATVSSLPRALARAYGTNPALLAEQARLRATDERYAQARAVYGPVLSMQGQYGYARDRFEALPGEHLVQRGRSGAASLALTQPLFAGGRLSAGTKVARAGIDVGRASLEGVETDILLDVMDAYVGVRRDAALLDIANHNLALLDRQLRDNETRFRAREVTVADMEQVRTRLELGRAQVETARGDLAVSQGRFVRIVGALPGKLDSLPPLPGLPTTIDEAYAGAEQDNPSLKSLRAQERAARAEVEVALADTRGTVSLRGDASYGSMTPYSLSRTQTLLRGQVVLDLPLYSSGQRSSRVREARELAEAVWHSTDQALRDARQQVAETWDRLATTRATIGSLRNAVSAADRAYEGAVIQQRAGDRTTLDVLDLARELLNARASLINALASEYSLGARLLAVTGRLQAKDLIHNAPLYDPEAHLRRVAHRGDTPPLTQIVDLLDGVAARDNRRDEESRDLAVALTKPAVAPLLPPSAGP